MAIKCKDGTFKKLENINRELGGKGVILPAEIKTVNYTLDDLTILNNVDSKAVLYCFVIDSEGKKYKKKYGKVKGVVGSILKLKQ